MLIDGRTIITGSFNFTKQAETSNAENMLVIRDKPTLYAAYEGNFRRHLDHSVPYEGREGAGETASGAKRRSRSR
jgi:phosphatidylserine/phosphatidylglycerophosphate/cardiolipin synthase-like enzyme